MKKVLLPLKVFLAFVILITGCNQQDKVTPTQQESVSSSSPVKEITYVHGSNSYIVKANLVDGLYVSIESPENKKVQEILALPNSVIFTSFNEKEKHYIFEDREKYDTFLADRIKNNSSSLPNGRTTAFTLGNSYFRMADAGALDPNYANYPIINVPLGTNSTIQFPYGGSFNSVDQQYYWRGINNLSVYPYYFEDKTSSYTIYNNTNYRMIVHMNKDGNYGGRAIAFEISPNSSAADADLTNNYQCGFCGDWDNEISSVIWKWY